MCFNSINWIGNGHLMPAGPLREKIDSISKYDAVFINGNEINISDLKSTIKNIIKISKFLSLITTLLMLIN